MAADAVVGFLSFFFIKLQPLCLSSIVSFLGSTISKGSIKVVVTEIVLRGEKTPQKL